MKSKSGATKKGIKLLSSVIVVVRSTKNASLLQRIMSNLSFERHVQVASIADAETEIMRKQPKAVLIDVSDYSQSEYRTIVEPFLLSLPGWIRVLLINTESKSTLIKDPAETGVNGILTDISRYRLTSALSADDARDIN